MYDMIWGFIAKYPTGYGTGFVVAFNNPVKHKWIYTNQTNLNRSIKTVELDFVNYALEHDLKHLPMTMFEHKLGRDLLELEMDKVAKEATKKQT